MTDERRSRDFELLKNAVQRDRTKDKRSGRNEPVQMMYRGQPVAGRAGRGGGAPGSPGSGASAPRSTPVDNGPSVKDSLRNLTQLFNDGLITTAEYEAKRAEIIDRL